uniref:(northern house mosquito) hypothetical protein n=1 Tax=Culex pipiens TaxID=7175 RepID=A0A8D8H9N5_CULPI
MILPPLQRVCVGDVVPRVDLLILLLAKRDKLWRVFLTRVGRSAPTERVPNSAPVPRLHHLDGSLHVGPHQLPQTGAKLFDAVGADKPHAEPLVRRHLLGAVLSLKHPEETPDGAVRRADGFIGHFLLLVLLGVAVSVVVHAGGLALRSF